MFPERIMLIWTGRLKDVDNPMEDIADILTKDSCTISRWTHLMQLVHITATPSDEASALLISVLRMSQKKGSQLKHRHQYEKFTDTTPEGFAFRSVYSSPGGERPSRVGTITLVCGG